MSPGITMSKFLHVRRFVLGVGFAMALSSVAVLATAAEPKTAPASNSQKSPGVRLVQGPEGFQLLRNGQPYFIRGAGGEGARKLLVESGGNSVRTWGADKLDPVLAEAHELGLTVTVGIWLGHERHGFSYNDADQVAEQYEKARQTILRYKDHPAVLMWGIGNEMEGYEQGDNAAIWSAINNIANLAKKIDPGHPTMTVVAEIGGNRVKNIHRLCPDIDIVGINCYGGIGTLPERYKAAGGTKPYVVTEFGPPGTWEQKKNAWGVVPELTSTEKAEHYRRAYKLAIASQPGRCLGSYVFHWGNKQEATATWFGMLLPDGKRLGAVDVMTEVWSGKPRANLCPAIQSLKLDGPDQVDPGATIRAKLDANDPEKDAMQVRWILQRENENLGVGGDAEEAPPTFPDAIVKGDIHGVEVRMPTDGGGYRLFAYVDDGRGGAAVANVPLQVKGPVSIPKSRRATLPLVVYDEGDREQPAYIPAGWLGNTKATKMMESCDVQPHAGKTCIKVEFQAKEGWAGVVWQSPAGDWGDKPGGWDLSGAKRLTFWARGEKGGEVVSFEFGLFNRDKRFFDTEKGKLEKVELTTEWKQYSIEIDGKDLARIKSGFAWVVAAKGQPVTFYLDDIQYE
jgi:hypothetical protein